MNTKGIVIAALALPAMSALHANDGGFVDTFGTQGREQIGFAPSLDIATSFVSFVDLAIQPDGKIIVSATVDNTAAAIPSTDIGVLRLNPNGTLDTNFGTQGQVIVPFDLGGTNNDVASSVLLQPNGRIVVCGEAGGDPNAGGSDFGIVRVTAGGLPDTHFSGDGKATVPFDIGPVGDRDDSAVRCDLQADGKIVAGGSASVDASTQRMAVARLNADGSRDTGFNGAGTATIDFGPAFPSSVAFSTKAQADGRTLLTGGAFGAGTASWAFARLTSTGQLDASFGNGGILLFDPGVASYAAYEALDAVVLPDNSIVAVGAMALAPALTNYDFGVFKLTANGSLDASFGNGGGLVIPFDLGAAFADIGVKVIRDAQGRFLMVGISNGSVAPFTASLVRVTASGQLDPTFGNGGKLTVATAPPPAADLGDQGTSVAITADGGILVSSIATYDAIGPKNRAGLAKLVGDTIFGSGFDD